MYKHLNIIRHFIRARNIEPHTLLQKMCQLIRKGSDEIINNEFTKKALLGELVDQLDLRDKEQLYYRIWEQAGNKNNDVNPISWGEQNRFEDMLLFVRFLGELVCEKGEFVWEKREK